MSGRPRLGPTLEGFQLLGQGQKSPVPSRRSQMPPPRAKLVDPASVEAPGEHKTDLPLRIGAVSRNQAAEHPGRLKLGVAERDRSPAGTRSCGRSPPPSSSESSRALLAAPVHIRRRLTYQSEEAP